MTTREHGRASVAWESQCSVHMPLTRENCLPLPWLIPPWFFHDMKWECSGQLACLAACAPSQGEFVLGASWGQITAACLPACLGHHSVGAGPQLLQSIPHPTNLPASSCPCPAGRVIYNPAPGTQPHKNSWQQYWGKRGSMRRQGQKYSFTRIPESCVTSQAPSITELLLAGPGEGFEVLLFVPG